MLHIFKSINCVERSSFNRDTVIIQSGTFLSIRWKDDKERTDILVDEGRKTRSEQRKRVPRVDWIVIMNNDDVDGRN